MMTCLSGGGRVIVYVKKSILHGNIPCKNGIWEPAMFQNWEPFLQSPKGTLHHTPCSNQCIIELLPVWIHILIAFHYRG